MDQHGDSTIQPDNETSGHSQFIEKTLQFLVPLSLLSISLCHIHGFSFFFLFFFSYLINLRFSTFIFPLLAYALDRKFMFLIRNGILALLAKNLRFSSSSPEFIHIGDFKQISELPGVKEATIEHDEASSKYSTLENDAVGEEQKQQETGCFYRETEETKSRAWIAESEEDDIDEVEDSTTLGVSPVEEGNYANVNTDELNKKFEEFIKKMKEEIRIEAQQLVECN